MNEYIINENTLAIVPITKDRTKVYEKENIIIVGKNSKQLIEESCEYYGSSYKGRKKGTADLIGVTHKSPIVIEESKELIFFPTSSPRGEKCSWISLNNLESNRSYDRQTMIQFSSDVILKIPISNKIINNQIMRATRLEVVHKKRKEQMSKNL